MPVDTRAIGKSYPADMYAVGREKIREYAAAVGETNPLHLELDAARAAGYPDLVAPPMFAVVYGMRAITPAALDPEVGMDLAMTVHGSQEFRWDRLVIAGDEISTTATVTQIEERGGLGFYVFETVSTNQRDERVGTAVWTNIVRAAS